MRFGGFKIVQSMYVYLYMYKYVDGEGNTLIRSGWKCVGNSPTIFFSVKKLFFFNDCFRFQELDSENFHLKTKRS